MPAAPAPPALAPFSPATRAWFASAFAAPTTVQREGWRRIAAGEHALLCAPTGSGKTLAAFLWALDRCATSPALDGFRVLYVSPLKALAYDVERNLRAPLVGIANAAAAAGASYRAPRVVVRTGDTPARERRRLERDAGDILITTPESLYLLLGSQARQTLRTVETVIVDEVHALAPTKRGAHLALSLERLVELVGGEPQRIGLSATQRPLEEVGRWLCGRRPVSIVDAHEAPRLDLTIEVPVEDMDRPDTPATAPAIMSDRIPGDLSREEFVSQERGIWPALYPRLVELVRAHRSTILFVNSRRLCERLSQRLNELAGEVLVRAHHGSIARAQRVEIEELLKAGQLRGLVATSSLELGIDMGAVDLVVQIESPGSVARGLQRIGRAGHSVGELSRGRIFPKYRGDLLEATVVARRMQGGEVEPIRAPKNPLDVLAQQLVATCATPPDADADVKEGGDWPTGRLEALARRCYSFGELSHELFVATLDLLAGRYPSDAFADLKPRLVWDRVRDVVTARRDARMLALVSGGTIPDRGMYGVYLGADGPRVGELDEEMVHESRTGQTFLLGATTWRIVEITRDRVLVAPAPGEPGRMPFWHGESPGRPIELGRALGEFVRHLSDKTQPDALAWLAREYKLDDKAARNLWRYVDEQRAATGTLPTDRSLTIERFRDELGDWRVCILSPFGARVHAPWALALEARLGQNSAGTPGAAGYSVQTLWSDDGLVLRCSSEDVLPDAAALLPDPEEVQDLVLGELGRSAMFATRFRENAARALLLPRRRPGLRTPLWAQRLKAQNLLAVASQHADFPILLETYRECLQDVFDVPALVELLAAVRRRDVRVVEVETPGASPFARSLAFAYVAAYMYEGDAPLAERKAQALALDRDLLRELLGEEDLRELLDPAVLDELEAELQSLAPERHVRAVDGMHDLLRRVGDLSDEELQARAAVPARPLAEALVASGRAVRVRVAGAERVAAVEDVARLRDALGVVPPPGLPSVFLDAQAAPLEGLVARYARTHAPFTAVDVGRRLGLLPAQVEPVLKHLAATGKIEEGGFRPGGNAVEWCDREVLRQLKRRTLARLRNQVAPVEAAVLGRFLPKWHRVGQAGAAPSESRNALGRLREAVEQLEGLDLPWSELEAAILPARVPSFQPRMLDELGALGDLVWIGRGALGPGDGKVALYRRDRVALLAEKGALPDGAGDLARALLAHLETRGASFVGQLAAATGATVDDLVPALWDLVWAGLVTNDTFAPLRALGRPLAALQKRGLRPRLDAMMGGRWSATSQLGSPQTDTARLHARAQMLLERWGIVGREAVAAEEFPGGFAVVAPVLRVMEEAGQVRRGYFVEGLGGAQYARPGAIDRLRALRDGADEVVTLSAIDPANPYGAVLPWPDAPGSDGSDGKPRRVAGARVVLVGGVPVYYVEAGGKRLRLFTVDDALAEAGIAGLRALAARRRHGELRLDKINGAPSLRSEHLALLKRLGFRVEPGAVVLGAATQPSVEAP